MEYVDAAGQIIRQGYRGYKEYKYLKRQLDQFFTNTNKKQKMDTASYGSGAAANTCNLEDPQFVAQVRNVKSRYGRKRRHNLRNVWHEVDKNNKKVWSRFQAFRSDGFQDGRGPLPMVYNRPVDESTNCQYPAYAFRLTSLPAGVQTAGQSEGFARPLVAYYLTSNNPNDPAKKGDFLWNTVPDVYLPNSGNDTPNTYFVTDRKGPAFEFNRGQVGFRHMYSDIKMTFYGQTQLPCQYHIYLCKFKDDVNAWPYSQAVTIPNGVETIYSHFLEGNRQETLADMWRTYFSGKLIHPNNKDRMATPANPFGQLPFQILKHDKVFVPAKTSDQNTRVLYKHFFRNDRHYKTGMSNVDQLADLTATENAPGTFNYPSTSEVFESSVFPKPEDEVWLMVTCETYVTTSGNATAIDPNVGGGPQLSSFDICIRNCHSLNESDIAHNNAVITGNPVVIPYTATGVFPPAPTPAPSRVAPPSPPDEPLPE